MAPDPRSWNQWCLLYPRPRNLPRIGAACPRPVSKMVQEDWSARRVSSRQNQKICGTHHLVNLAPPVNLFRHGGVIVSFPDDAVLELRRGTLVCLKIHTTLRCQWAHGCLPCLTCSLLTNWFNSYTFACDSYIVTEVQGCVHARACCLFWSEESCPSMDCVRL